MWPENSCFNSVLWPGNRWHADIQRKVVRTLQQNTVLTVSTWGTSSHCTTQWMFKTWCACSWTYSSHDAQPSVLETVDSSSETWLKLLIISTARAPSLHQQSINSDDALHMKFKPVWKRDLLQVCGAEHSSKNRPSRERPKNISCVAVDFYWLLLVNL